MLDGSTEPGNEQRFLKGRLSFRHLQPIRRFFQMSRLATFITVLLNTAQAEADHGRISGLLIVALRPILALSAEMPDVGQVRFSIKSSHIEHGSS
jgi:hypothetical protein